MSALRTAADTSDPTFREDVADEDLVYFLVNVGDADAQVVVLPKRRDGGRVALVVDVVRERKITALLEALMDADDLLRPAGDPLFPLVCATHPHHDHISGMARFIRRWRDQIGELWEPGYRHTSSSFIEMMNEIEESHFAHAQPAAGFTRYIGLVRVTALTPAISLRNRFDTYGVDLNDASIALKIDFPASRVEIRNGTRTMHDPVMRKLILGADSLTLSWAHALMDWPELHPSASEVARQLHKAQGASPLKADLFKVPHHGSKHGINLELVEQIAPQLALLSCRNRDGRFGFPHDVAMQMLREAQQPIATNPHVPRKLDHENGIHTTGDLGEDKLPLGTIAVVVGPRRRKWHVWRFGDAPGEHVDLSAAALTAGVLQAHG